MIAEETGTEAVAGSAEEMETLIHDQLDLYEGSYTEEDDELRERVAIQNDTAFPPSAPKPRPVEFPLR